MAIGYTVHFVGRRGLIVCRGSCFRVLVRVHVRVELYIVGQNQSGLFSCVCVCVCVCCLLYTSDAADDC